MLRNKVKRITLYSMIFRFGLKLLFKKLNVLKAIKEPVPVLQFGIATGVFNLIFHLVRRFIALKRKSRNKRNAE